MTPRRSPSGAWSSTGTSLLTTLIADDSHAGGHPSGEQPAEDENQPLINVQRMSMYGDGNGGVLDRVPLDQAARLVTLVRTAMCDLQAG